MNIARMVYNMLNPDELEKFKERVNEMVDKANKMHDDWHNERFFVVELKERQPARSIRQNAYLWVTITYVALEEGYPKDYIEQVFKEVNKDVFLRERENKMGKKFRYWRHIPDLDKQEMSECIDRWLHHCAMERGLYIPSPQDHAYMLWQTQVERNAELNKEFL